MTDASNHDAKDGAGPPSTARRDQLLSIERSIQSAWQRHSVFAADADPLPRAASSKYFATFPYPYMNGALHLGHAFTLAKVDFECAFQRLKGKKVLFPFAFHCTGMPIAASADKVRRELELYGNPPRFPRDDEGEAEGEGDGEGQTDEARHAETKEAEQRHQEAKEGLSSSGPAHAEGKRKQEQSAEDIERIAATVTTAPVAQELAAKADKKRKVLPAFISRAPSSAVMFHPTLCYRPDHTRRHSETLSSGSPRFLLSLRPSSASGH